LKKQVNDACKEYNGFKFRTTRRKGKEGLDKHIPKHYLPWMLTHSETMKKSNKRSANHNVITKVKRRNLATYKKTDTMTEDEILEEIANIDLLKEQLTKRLNDIRENGKVNSNIIVDKVEEDIDSNESVHNASNGKVKSLVNVPFVKNIPLNIIL
jgi:hypothetical protein